MPNWNWTHHRRPLGLLSSSLPSFLSYLLYIRTREGQQIPRGFKKSKKFNPIHQEGPPIHSTLRIHSTPLFLYVYQRIFLMTQHIFYETHLFYSVAVPISDWWRWHLRYCFEDRFQPMLASQLLCVFSMQRASGGPHLFSQGWQALLRKASCRNDQAKMFILRWGMLFMGAHNFWNCQYFGTCP